MKHSLKVMSTVISLTLLPVTSALAQQEQGIIIQLQPIDVGLVSPNYVTITYVPLDDVARALGSNLQYDQARNYYSVQPGEGGILRFNPGGAGLISPKTRPQAEGQRIRPEAVRRPQPVATRQAASFGIGDQLVSKGIIVVDNKPHMPLDDLATAMGAVIEPAGEPKPRLTLQRGASPILGLSERGIIIVETREQ